MGGHTTVLNRIFMMLSYYLRKWNANVFTYFTIVNGVSYDIFWYFLYVSSFLGFTCGFIACHLFNTPLFVVKWKYTIIRLKCLIVAKYYYFAFCIAIVKSHPFFALIVLVDTLNTMFNISGDTGQPFFFLTSDIFFKMLGVE